MKERLSLLILFLSFSIVVQAQTNDDWEEIYGQVEDFEEEESTSWEEMYEQLSDLKAHPINLNTATRSDLERLPFLTAQQMEDISEYLYHYAPIQTWGELAMIESLSERSRQLLHQFTYLGEMGKPGFPTWGSITKWGKHDLTTTAKIPYYNRKGDKNGYLGYPYRHGLKYRFRYGNNIQAGFVASQDAGEPFFANKNKWGYDYYSLYAVIRNWGKLKTLAVGKYRLRYGMGLVLNNDFMMGKVTGMASGSRISNTIKAHSSRSSANYMQGVAATFQLNKHWEFSAFVSYRPIDTTTDSTNTAIRTLLTSGYHRTESELEHKNNSKIFLGGTNINFSKMGLRAGLTAAYYSFDKPLQPNIAQLYRLYDAQGQSFYNIGINYGYINRRWNIGGETAMSKNKAWATINCVSFRATDRITLTLLQRFYSYRYQALFARSFSDGGKTKNESGIYLGAEWQPIRHLLINVYADFSHFPWLKYQRSSSSFASDYFLSATYTYKQSAFYLRYRLHSREKDNEKKTMLIPHREHRTRLSWKFNMPQSYLKTQVDMVHSSYKKMSKGWMITENGGYHLNKVQLHAAISYFHTDDFQSSIYNYERGTLHNFSFPSYNGHGIRYMVLAQAQLLKNFQVVVKCGTTNYFDRNKIGSSYQEINRSSMTETDIQLTWKF